MKRRVFSTIAIVASAIALPALGATEAAAANKPGFGKSSIYSCWSRTITSDKRQMSVICNPPGTKYYFQAKCGYYSAGSGGSFWRSSSWTTDGKRATVNCGSGASIIGVGATVYYS